MSAKGPFAGFLVAVLLAMSSWSSACDLSCAIKSRQIGCATGQSKTAQNATETAAAQEMDMSHCSHAGADTEQAPPGQSLSANPCAHDACRLIAVSTAAKNSAARSQHSATASIFVAVTRPLNSRGPGQLAEREYPPPKTALLNPLSLSLRI